MATTSLLQIADGGTNAASMATSTGIVKYDGTRLVTSTATIDSSNRMLIPSQPAFMAYVNTVITNVSGDSTEYTIIYDVEVFDQGSNFTLATSIFTAPVTGKYQFNVVCGIGGGTIISASVFRLTTSNLTYRMNGYVTPGGTTASTQTLGLLVDMDAADTCTVTITTVDSGGKVDDVLGTSSGAPSNIFSGQLVC